MARTIKQIQSEIINNLTSKMTLSSSSVAEWRLWCYVVALAIYSFEVILDAFRSQIESVIDQTRPGTIGWYTYMCYQFQNGHELKLISGQIKYAVDVPESKIISIAAVCSVDGLLAFKVAKTVDGRITPLSSEQRGNFVNYIDAISMAGTKISVISKEADIIKYNLEVYYDPAYPQTKIRTNIELIIEAFNKSTEFGGVVYSQRLTDAVTDIQGVVTAKLMSLHHRSVTDDEFSLVDISVVLDAGYYNFSDDSTLTLRTIKELQL